MAIANASDSAFNALEHSAAAPLDRGAGPRDWDDFPGKGIFRGLTDEELSIASSDEPIVVTGYRLESFFNSANLLMWSVDGYDDPGSSSQPEPPCWWGMTEQERTDSVVDEQAAQVLKAILAQPDQRMEYGSVIYVDANGDIQHSPLRPSSSFTTQLDFSMVPLGSDGTTDFSRVLAVVHSHPAEGPKRDGSAGYEPYYVEGQPEYLLVPSNWPEGTLADDWDHYDYIVNQITRDGGDASQFSLYIAGFNGTTLELNQYFGNDKNTTTANAGDPVELGYISPLSQC